MYEKSGIKQTLTDFDMYRKRVGKNFNDQKLEIVRQSAESDKEAEEKM